MAENERIIELSINEKQFKQQMVSIIDYMSIFEKRIDSFEKKINKIDLSGNFKNIDKNMSESSKNISKDLSSINNNLDGIANTVNNNVLESLTSLNNKFSFLGITGLKVLNQLSDSFISFTKNIINSMSELENMQAAMSKFEKKNNAIRTIMNSITDDKVPEAYKNQIDGTVKTIDYVTDALSKLETFSDETSYDFTQMTESIGKLVSMGNTLEQASDTVLGMANWNSLVGKNVKEFENLSYVIEKVAGLGYVGLRQFQMLSNYMDPQTKKNILEEAAALGTLQKVSDDTFKTIGKGEEVSLSSFSNNLKEKWLTMDVLNNVMAKYSTFSNAVIEDMDKTGATASKAIKRLEKDYDSVSVKAFKSAQEAKTFGEAIESVQVAVTTGWAKSFEYIFGNVDYASKIFTDLANQLFKIFANGKYLRNELLSQWVEGGGRDTLFSALLGDEVEVENRIERVGGLLSYIADISKTINEIINDVFGLLNDDAVENNIEAVDEFAYNMIELTESFKKFIVSIKPTERFLNNLKIIVGTLSVIIKNFLNTIYNLIKLITPPIMGLKDILFELITDIFAQIYIYIDKLSSRLSELANTILSKVYPVIDALKPLFYEILNYMYILFHYIPAFIQPIQELMDIVINFIDNIDIEPILNSIYKVYDGIMYLVVNVNKILNTLHIWEYIDKFILILKLLYDNIIIFFKKVEFAIKNSEIYSLFVNVFDRIISEFNKFKFYLFNTDFGKIISNFFDEMIIAASSFNLSYNKITNNIRTFFDSIFGQNAFNQLVSTLDNFLSKFKKYIKTFKFSTLIDDLLNSIQNINWEEVVDFIIQSLLKLGVLITTAIKNIIVYINNNIQKIFDLIKSSNLYDNILSNFSGIFKNLKETFIKIASGIFDIIRVTSPILLVLPVVYGVVKFFKLLAGSLETAQTFADAAYIRANSINKLALATLIISMVYSIYTIGNMSIAKILKGVIVISSLMILFSNLPNLLKTIDNIKPVSTTSLLGIVALFGILVLLVNSIVSVIKTVESNGIVSSIIGIGSILLAINLISTLLLSVKIDNKHHTILTELSSFFNDILNIFLVILALKIFMSSGDIVKTLLAIGAVLAGITVILVAASAISDKISNFSKKGDKEKSGIIGGLFGSFNASTLLALSFAISAITSSLMALSAVNIISLSVALGGLVIVIGLMVAFGKQIADLSASLLALSSAILLMSISITLLSNVKNSLLGLIELLVIMVAPFAAVIVAMKLFHISVKSLSTIFNSLGNMFKSMALLISSFGISLLASSIAFKIFVSQVDNINKITGMTILKMLAFAAGIYAISIAAKPLVKIVSELIQKLIDLIKVFAAFIGKKLTSGIDNLKKNFMKDGVITGNIFIDSISRKISSVSSIFGDAANDSGKKFNKNLNNFVKKSKKTFTNLGKFSKEGFLKGFEGLQNGVLGNITNVVDSIKNFLGIASPSKLFYRFGLYVAQGYELGIKGEQPKIEKLLRNTFSISDSVLGDYIKQFAKLDASEYLDMGVYDFSKLDSTLKNQIKDVKKFYNALENLDVDTLSSLGLDDTSIDYAINNSDILLEILDNVKNSAVDMKEEIAESEINNIDYGLKMDDSVIESYNKRVDKIREYNNELQKSLDVQNNRKLIDAYITEFSRLNSLGYLDLSEEEILDFPIELRKNIESVMSFIEGTKTNNFDILTKLGFDVDSMNIIIEHKDEILSTIDQIDQKQQKLEPFKNLLIYFGITEQHLSDIDKALAYMFNKTNEAEEGFKNITIPEVEVPKAGFFDGILNTLSEIGNVLYRLIVEPIISIFKTLWQIIKDTAKLIVESVLVLLTPFTILWNALKMIFNGVKQWWAWYKKTPNPELPKMARSTVDLGSKVNKLGTTFKNISNVFKMVGEFIDKWIIKPIVALLKFVGIVMVVVNSVEIVIKGVAVIILALRKGVLLLGIELKKIGNIILNFLAGGMEKVKNVGAKVLKVASEFIQKIPGIAQLFSIIVEGIKNVFSLAKGFNVFKFFNDLADELLEIRNRFDAFIKGQEQENNDLLQELFGNKISEAIKADQKEAIYLIKSSYKNYDEINMQYNDLLKQNQHVADEYLKAQVSTFTTDSELQKAIIQRYMVTADLATAVVEIMAEANIEREEELKKQVELDQEHEKNLIYINQLLTQNGVKIKDVLKEYNKILKKDGQDAADDYLKGILSGFIKNEDQVTEVVNNFKDGMELDESVLNSKYGEEVINKLKEAYDEIEDYTEKKGKELEEKMKKANEFLTTLGLDSEEINSKYKLLYDTQGKEVADLYLNSILENSLKDLPQFKDNFDKIKEAIAKIMAGEEEGLEGFNFTSAFINSGATNEIEKYEEEQRKKREEEQKNIKKAHESFLKNYKEELKSERDLVKYYADQEKKIDEQKVKDKVEGFNQTLIDQKDYTANAQNTMTTWLDNLANSYEQADSSFNDYLENLDENTSEEDKIYARRMEALKKWNSEWKRNSGFSWDTSGKEKFKQEHTELKSTDILKNQNSQLQGYKNFVAEIEKLAGTNVSDEFIRAVWEGGPGSDIYKNAVSLSEKELENFAANYDLLTGVQKKDSEVLERIIRNRKLYQEAKKNGTKYNPESNAIEITQPTIQFHYKRGEIKQGFEDAGAGKDELESLYQEYQDRTNELKDEGIQIGEARSQAYQEIIDRLNEENGIDPSENSGNQEFSSGTIIQNTEANTNEAYNAGYNQVVAAGQGAKDALPTLDQTKSEIYNALLPSSPQNQEGQENKENSEDKSKENGNNQILEQWKQFGQNIDNELSKGVDENISKVTDVVSKMCQEAIQAARTELGIASPSTVFYEMGEYIIQGLCDAIVAGQSSVTEAMVSEVLAKMEEEAEEEESINSPSKKWYRFGSFIDQGLANGIAENAQNPLNTLHSLISDISDNMEYDDEYNPVITPVVDLSEAHKQSKEISTLFASDQTMHISSDFNGSRINQNKGQNSDANSNKPTSITFTQNNYSPKELSRSEIYRQTNNQFSKIKTLLDK